MRTYIGWITIAIACLGAIATFLFLFKPSSSTTPPIPELSFTTIATSTAPSTNSAQARNPPKGYKEYRNTDYGFSIFYPENLPPTEFRDRGYALTVSFQAAEGQEGFQVYVAPINGTKVSAERFRLDAPSGVIKNQQKTTVDGAEAISFEGLSYEIGATHEVWFIHGDFLFEVTTYKDLKDWLGSIMETWKFI